METFLLVIHLIVSVALVVLILLQQGKGADIGAAFGSGASQTVFGARGSASFLSKTTKWLAVTFFVTSMGLTYLAIVQTQGRTAAKPATPATSTPATTPNAPPADVPAVPNTPPTQ